MTLVTFNTRDKRALVLGAAIVVPALLYVGAIAPVTRSITANRHALTEARKTFAADSALVAHTSALSAQQSTTTTWLTHEARRLFRGHDDISATSDLNNYIIATAANMGVQLRRSETRPAVLVSGSVRAVRVDINAEGSARAALRFIRALEQGNRLVRMGRISMDRAASDIGLLPQPGQVPQPGGIRPRGAQRLAVTAEVYGYALIPDIPAARVVSSEMGASYVPLSGRTSGASDNAIADGDIADPFSLDRGEPPPMPSVPTQHAPPPFPVRLLGTVIGRSSNTFAMCQVDSAPPAPVHEGEQVGGYTLQTIQPGSIVLADDTGHTVRLTLPVPGT